jgi:ABC-2 type transport system ATP-binding protein
MSVPRPARGSAAQDLRQRVEALKACPVGAAGDFFALLGPNGAGKSTLIGVVSSLVNASAGSVKVFGVDIAAERSRRCA